MQRVLYVAIALSLVFGTSTLASCQREQADSETSSSPETTSDALDSSASTAEETSNSATSTPQQQTSPAETPINPPQSAKLRAQQADAQINLRSQPAAESTAKGYGLVGDPVKLLKAASGTDGLTWYYIKFDESGAEGWIRGDFINTADASPTDQMGTVRIDNYTIDELFAVSGGGCGMTLIRAGSDQIIFSNGLETTSMWMKLNGRMTQFRRTAASGEEFYGQAINQSFTSLDSAAQAEVTVSLGEQRYEVVDIESGTLHLESAGESIEIPVEGDAGC